MADFRQIIWRKSILSRWKHSTKAQIALPHNVACPFCPFFASGSRRLSAAMICGRKGLMALVLAAMLKKMALPGNECGATDFLAGLTRKPLAQMSLGGLAIL